MKRTRMREGRTRRGERGKEKEGDMKERRRLGMKRTRTGEEITRRGEGRQGTGWEEGCWG